MSPRQPAPYLAGPEQGHRRTPSPPGRSPLVRALAGAVGRSLLDLLSPYRCSACDEPLRARAAFCAPCAATVLRAPVLVPRTDRGPIRVVAAALYGGAMAEAICRFKYDDRPDLATPLGELAWLAAQRAQARADVVVPVPLHPRRLAERGYNQAALIARPVAKRLGVSVLARGLRRTRATAPQASLAGAARSANVSGAFRVRRTDAVRARQVMLVDDVFTTGATLIACARALLDAGAEGVDALVLARAERAFPCSQRFERDLGERLARDADARPVR